MKKSRKKSRRWYILTLQIIILALLITTGFLVLPNHLTAVSHDLEDVKAYFLALKIQAEKDALQKTLPGHEEVIEIYEQPRYVQVTDTCDFEFVGPCVPIMTGPGMDYPKAFIYYEHQGPFPERVRTGQVFPMSALIKAKDGSLWYQITFNKSKMLFPGRIHGNWYVPADHFTPIDFTPIHPENDPVKKIVISLKEQKLLAYEGDTVFLETSISTGQEALNLATDTGQFRVYKKSPLAIMEGPLPSMVSLMNDSNIPNFEYTLFVPYAMAFNPSSAGTAFIHEAYWHNGFGTERSHGCVNVNPRDAVTLYNWTPDPSIRKTPVTVIR
jgi:hypothetical protein